MYGLECKILTSVQFVCEIIPPTQHTDMIKYKTGGWPRTRREGSDIWRRETRESMHTHLLSPIVDLYVISYDVTEGLCPRGYINCMRHARYFQTRDQATFNKSR